MFSDIFFSHKKCRFVTMVPEGPGAFLSPRNKNYERFLFEPHKDYEGSFNNPITIMKEIWYPITIMVGYAQRVESVR